MMKFRLYILPRPKVGWGPSTILNPILPMTPTDFEFKSESSVNDFIASGGPAKFKNNFSEEYGEEIELTILRVL
jgi:hypothetical protein